MDTFSGKPRGADSKKDKVLLYVILIVILVTVDLNSNLVHLFSWLLLSVDCLVGTKVLIMC